MRNALRWLAENRRRLAPLVLVLAVVVVGAEASRAVPRETRVHVRLSDPAAVREVGIDYLGTSGAATSARFSYPRGAQPRVDDVRDLAPGHYTLHVDVLRADGSSSADERELDVPAEGVVLVDTGHGAMP